MNYQQERRRECTDRGQASILLVGVVVVAVVLTAALALIAQAMVHRVRAHTAADAVALAMVVDPESSHEITAWYQSQGVAIEQAGTATIARSGPSQAASWASTDAAAPTAPVIRAIVARLEQLVGREFSSVTWGQLSFQVTATDATVVRPLAAEFGLCRSVESILVDAGETFELC